MPRRPEPSDYYGASPTYEGMPLKAPPRIVFGRDVLCPSCRGKRIETPMDKAEKAERKRLQRQGQPLATMQRWPCSRCGGRGVTGLDD